MTAPAKSLALVPTPRSPGKRVARELDRLLVARGKPARSSATTAPSPPSNAILASAKRSCNRRPIAVASSTTASAGLSTATTALMHVGHRSDSSAPLFRRTPLHHLIRLFGRG